MSLDLLYYCCFAGSRMSTSSFLPFAACFPATAPLLSPLPSPLLPHAACRARPPSKALPLVGVLVPLLPSLLLYFLLGALSLPSGNFSSLLSSLNAALGPSQPPRSLQRFWVRKSFPGNGVSFSAHRPFMFMACLAPSRAEVAGCVWFYRFFSPTWDGRLGYRGHRHRGFGEDAEVAC